MELTHDTLGYNAHLQVKVPIVPLNLSVLLVSIYLHSLNKTQTKEKESSKYCHHALLRGDIIFLFKQVY